MNINDMYDMCDTLSRELSAVNDKVRKSGGKLSGSDLDYVDKLTHAIKSIKTTIAMVEAEDTGSGTYPYHGSYARRRDSMGRYSAYSRDDDMISEVRQLMQDAPDDRTKQEFRKFIDKIERM